MNSSKNFETLENEEQKHRNLITSGAKKAFQMKLKSFFIIFEEHYVGETEILAGTRCEKNSIRFSSYNLGHNILRLFDILPNFPFIASETNRDY